MGAPGGSCVSLQDLPSRVLTCNPQPASPSRIASSASDSSDNNCSHRWHAQAVTGPHLAQLMLNPASTWPHLASNHRFRHRVGDNGREHLTLDAVPGVPVQRGAAHRWNTPDECLNDLWGHQGTIYERRAAHRNVRALQGHVGGLLQRWLHAIALYRRPVLMAARLIVYVFLPLINCP